MKRVPNFFGFKKVRVRYDIQVQKGKQKPTNDLEKMVIEKNDGLL